MPNAPSASATADSPEKGITLVVNFVFIEHIDINKVLSFNCLLVLLSIHDFNVELIPQLKSVRKLFNVKQFRQCKIFSTKNGVSSSVL